MCGIVGYIGREQAAPILLEGLSKLEYRGYDSAGMAVYGEQRIEIVKAKGRLQVLRELTDDGNGVKDVVVLVIQDGPHMASLLWLTPIHILTKKKQSLWYTMELLKIISHYEND